MAFAAAWLTFAATLVAQALPAPVSTSVLLTREAYVLELGRLQTAIQALDERAPASAGQVTATLPRAWRVATDAGAIEIDASWLRDGLERWRRRPEPAVRHDLGQALQLYVEEAASADTAPALSNARAELDRILSSREFARVHGPSMFDRFRQQFFAWLIDRLARVVGSSAVPTVTRWVIRGLVLVALGVAAFWLYRSLRGIDRPDDLRLARFSPPALRPWRALLADARAAGDRGDWRDATHLVYWTAIGFLEANRAWRPDASRTPREYVRLLPSSDSAHAPLDTITRLFEQVWYAAATADADGFNRALAAVEELGCLSR